MIQAVNDDGLAVPSSYPNHFTGLKVISPDGSFETMRYWGCNHANTHDIKYQSSLCEYLTQPLIRSFAVYCPSKTGERNHCVILCDQGTPPVVLGENTYSLLRLEQGLFKKHVFWTIPAFEFSSNKQIVIWHLLVQKVLHRFKHSVALYKGRPTEFTNNLAPTHNLLQYFRSANISSRESNNTKIIEYLLSDLHEYSLLAEVSKWLGALFSQELPDLMQQNLSWFESLVTYNPVSYQRSHRYSETNRILTENLREIQKIHYKVCKYNANMKNSHINFQRPWV